MILGEFTCPPKGRLSVEMQSFWDGRRVINNLADFKIKFFGSQRTGDIALYRSLSKSDEWDYLLLFGESGVTQVDIPENKIYALYLIDSPLSGEDVSINLKIFHHGN